MLHYPKKVISQLSEALFKATKYVICWITKKSSQVFLLRNL